MSLMDSLRHAEQRAADTARGGARRAKAGFQAAEASILRSLQSRRQPEEPRLSFSANRGPREQDPPANRKGRTAIVSINGQDVGKMQCTGK